MHLWVKGIQVCSNEGLRLFGWEDNYEIAKISWRIVKIFFSRTTEPISTILCTKHLWVKGIRICCFPYDVRKRRDRERDRDKEKERERKRDRERETDRQIDRQTDRQTENKDKDRLKYIWIHIFLFVFVFLLSLFLGFSIFFFLFLSRTLYGKEPRINRYKYS